MTKVEKCRSPKFPESRNDQKSRPSVQCEQVFGMGTMVWPLPEAWLSTAIPATRTGLSLFWKPEFLDQVDEDAPCCLWRERGGMDWIECLNGRRLPEQALTVLGQTHSAKNAHTMQGAKMWIDDEMLFLSLWDLQLSLKTIGEECSTDVRISCYKYMRPKRDLHEKCYLSKLSTRVSSKKWREKREKIQQKGRQLRRIRKLRGLGRHDIRRQARSREVKVGKKQTVRKEVKWSEVSFLAKAFGTLQITSGISYNTKQTSFCYLNK